MKKLIFIYILVSSFIAFSQTPPQPKLVVGIVVDQMSYDHLYRFWENYSEEGFKRLVKNGFSCENHHYNYIPTYTGPGHASIYTGTVPGIHGIVSNDWFDRNTNAFMYCASDSTIQSVGTSAKTGQMSPVNMLTTTICDELKLSNNHHSKIIGIALKDRGAILPAGHIADAAYWFDGVSNTWISSTHYMQQLPAWVNNFNNLQKANAYMANDWNLLLAPEKYQNSTADNVQWERIFNGETAPVFPHRLSTVTNMEMIKGTPYGNTFTSDFAKEAISNENLGDDEFTDILCVSYSSPDYIGHYYGPHSMEIEDNYIRLDRDIASFIQFLDTEIGSGNYLIFLSSDHGVAPAAGYMQSLDIPSGFINETILKAKMDSILEKEFGADSLILSYANQQLYLNFQLMKKIDIHQADIYAIIFEAFLNYDGIANIINLPNLSNALLPKEYQSLILNGIYPKRSGDIQILYEPNWMSYGSTGSTHGAHYNYDTHIPLLWYGWKIQNGKTWRKTEVTDIAPTLAAMLRIKAPNGSIGRVIDEMK